jgi:predicted nucleic-acid-binding Zn-ribbon protein
MQKIKPYVIDLTRVRGKGNVKCPKCGVEISPDDTSEDAYSILEPVVEEERLERIVLQCNRCGSRISLVGFNATC